MARLEDLILQDTGVVPAVYGSSISIPKIILGSNGQILSVENVPITKLIKPGE